MPRHPSSPVRRLATAARWPFGVVLTSWRYLWRTTPMRRAEVSGSLRHDSPPPLPAGVAHDRLQLPEDGYGPLLHRRYRARVRDPELSAQQLFARVQADPDSVSPSEFATFQKQVGDEGGMSVGDEFVVRMAAPWDGPVRVVDRTPTSHRFATLEGHLEAGQIEFSATGADGELELTIESWARSGDRVSDLLFDRMRMAKEIQVHMWVSYLERLMELSGGRRSGLLELCTRRVEEVELGEPVRPATDRGRRRLEAVSRRPLNFDPHADGPFTAEAGWHVDHYCRALPAEPPGDPVPGGAWEIARGLMVDYRFADPSIVRATYDPARPLAERNMLLQARLYGLRFRFGVRIGDVVDETREVEGRPVRVWGWSYRTLEGHLEAGEMGYQAWKWLDDGTVEFRIHRFVRSATGGNPLVRLGFRLFGRREQVRFAQRACRRMAELVEAELGGRPASGDVSAARPPAERAAGAGAAAPGPSPSPRA